MVMLSDEELIALALQAREYAYAPYSGFEVGAAALFDSGNVYKGCNIENAAFGAGICAERAAVFTGVAAGEIKRGGRIAKIVVVGGKKGKNLDFCPPCGICLQVISEFARNSKECEVVLVKTELVKDQHRVETTLTYKLAELLPLEFALNSK
ncbi:MAG: cytidine deaminase [Bacillota bacterium]|jgi:cytidine deaminase